jgi:hypothetical protein
MVISVGIMISNALNHDCFLIEKFKVKQFNLYCMSNTPLPVYRKTSILRVLQAIPSPLPVVYSIKIVQAEQN